MTEEKIRELFLQGFDCSQVVLAAYAEKYGLDEETANKVSACFGGGMMCGDTCGTVTGGLMAIGLKYGHFKADDMPQKEIMMAKSAEFRQKVMEKYGSCQCRDLLGYDLSKPGALEEVLESGKLFSFCPKLARGVLDILETVME